MHNEKDKTELFEHMPVPEALRVMVVPAIVSQIIVLIYNMADTFYIGRTNNPYMVAGVSLILPLFNMSICIANLAGVGGGTLISRLLGIHRDDEACKVSAFSFWMAFTLMLCMSLGILIFIRPILTALGAGENTYRFARDYTLCVLVFGGIPTVLSSVMSSLTRSIGLSKEAGFGITLGGILNIFLDPLFMFVILPEGYEVLGVGIATLISNCIACVYFFAVICRTRENSDIRFRLRNGMPEKSSIAAIFKVGLPAAITMLLFDIDYIIIDKLMVAHSDLALAAVGITLKVERLPLNIGVGICMGMTPLIAYNFSSGNEKRMDGFINLSLKTGLIFAAVSIVLYECFAPYLARFFIGDAETVRLATNFLRVRILATPFMFMSFFTVHIFQAFGKGHIALLLGVVRWVVFNIPMLFVLDHFFGMMGIVSSQVTADILNVITSFIIYVNQRKHMKIHG